MEQAETNSTSVSMFADIRKLMKTAIRQLQNERLKVFTSDPLNDIYYALPRLI